VTDFARLAEDVRRTFLERYATEHERALLEAASDPGTIVVRMAYGEDLIVRPPGAKPIDASELPPATDEQSQKILRRVELRSELRLPARKCNTRRPREGCHCL
jgi:hypothetical protein